jgi:hypothetical protein
LALSTDTYYAQEHSLQTPVTDEERENADAPLTPDADGTQLVTEKIMIGRERALMTLATTAANYATGMSLQGVAGAPGGGQFQQFDAVGSLPITVLRSAIKAVHDKIFRDPNVIIMPYKVMWTLLDHTTMIERIKYSQPGVLNPQLVATLLGIENMTIVVPGIGFQASAGAAVSYLWDNDVVVAYVPPTPGRKIPSYGYEFVWGYGGRPQVVDRWREDKRKSDILRCSRRYDAKLTALDSNLKQIAGFLLLDAVI